MSATGDEFYRGFMIRIEALPTAIRFRATIRPIAGTQSERYEVEAVTREGVLEGVRAHIDQLLESE